MYLVNRNQTLIELVWIYTHSEFEKRPPDKNLKQLLQELIESQANEEAASENEDNSAPNSENNSN